jgi:glycerol-3-phosphate dehydrogenase (NAD(P)+)
LGRAEGANPLTYMGLAGMGDLIATCTSQHSRNRALGEHIAGGGTVEQFERETHMVAEGATACVTVAELGERLGSRDADHAPGAWYRARRPRSTSAVAALMGRDATDELHGMELIDG